MVFSLPPLDATLPLGSLPATTAPVGLLTPALRLTGEGVGLASRDAAVWTSPLTFTATVDAWPSDKSAARAGVAFHAAAVFSNTEGRTTVRNSTAIRRAPTLAPSLGELSGGAPETAERNPLAFVRSVYPALTERDYYAGVRPLLQAVRQGSSHTSILLKMLLYTLSAAEAREGLSPCMPGARCGAASLKALSAPSATALLGLVSDGGPKLVAASALPRDRAFTAFVAAAAAPFHARESGSRLDRVAVAGDETVTAVWGFGDVDLTAVPWDSVEMLSYYTDAYAASVGAHDDLERAIGLAALVPWRLTNGPDARVCDWLDDLVVPSDHRMTDALPHCVRAPLLPLSLDERMGLSSTGTTVCVRMALLAPTALTWALQHAGVWHLGRGLAGKMAVCAGRYVAPDNSMASAFRNCVGAIFDIDLGFTPGCGPGGRVDYALVTGPPVTLEAGEGGAAAATLGCRLPRHVMYWHTVHALPRATSGAPLLAREASVRGALACALASGVDVSIDPQVARTKGTHAFADRLGPGGAATRILPGGSWWRALDLPTTTADGSCAVAWLCRPRSRLSMSAWLAAGALAAGGEYSVGAYAYGGPDQELPAELADPGYGADAWDEEYSWLRGAGAVALGQVTGPVFDPAPPPEARATESGFGYAAEAVDPAGAAAVHALHGAPGEPAALAPAAGLAAAATALAAPPEPGEPPDT